MIEVDPRNFRPTEVELVLGDPSKAHAKVGWCHKTSFEMLVQEMVKADLSALGHEQRKKIIMNEYWGSDLSMLADKEACLLKTEPGARTYRQYHPISHPLAPVPTI